MRLRRTLRRGRTPGGRGRPDAAPLRGTGRRREGEPTSQRSEASPAAGLASLGPQRRPLPRQDTGATGTPAPHRGPVVPQLVLHCFRKQNPERDTQPATGGRERARPPGGWASLGLSTSDKPPQAVTVTSWGNAQALTAQDALTGPGQPPPTPSACAVVPRT